jgi:glycerate 2-kinase
MPDVAKLAAQARAIWDAGVAAAEPRRLVRDDLTGPLAEFVARAPRLLVVGGGKAGAAMAAGVEDALADRLEYVTGLVNVPQGHDQPLRRIELHAARPAGSNFPTSEGVAGSERMLKLLQDAGSNDVAICLISGGGSALLPAPAEGISLADKQETTRLLHACGASIDEMNAVRKHLSRLKGGGMARAFHGGALYSLIISDVVGDPLDVIASGPTAPDRSTFADVYGILRRFDLLATIPASVRKHIEDGMAGKLPETLKQPLAHIDHRILGSNTQSLRASEKVAGAAGFHVLNLGAFIEGETSQVAVACAGIVRSIVRDRAPIDPPCCILLGGETTVSLGTRPGKGGRNQEFVLAMIHKLGSEAGNRVLVLSAGTDGEDGPTDAAGAVGGSELLSAASHLGIDPADYLRRHDAYSFFDQTGGLIRTGLTGTNVMDIRVILIA